MKRIIFPSKKDEMPTVLAEDLSVWAHIGVEFPSPGSPSPRRAVVVCLNESSKFGLLNSEGLVQRIMPFDDLLKFIDTQAGESSYTFNSFPEAFAWANESYNKSGETIKFNYKT